MHDLAASNDPSTSFTPISPRAAVEILDAADVGVDRHQLLPNLAMAGVVKGYDRLVETDVVGQPRTEVRDSRIDRSIWRRIVAEDMVAGVYDTGSAHLGSPGQADRVSMIGIRFDATSVASAAADHGTVPPPPPIVAKPVKQKPISPSRPAEPMLPIMDEPAIASPELRRATLDPGTVALSIAETAGVLGVSLGTVNNLIKREQLAIKKIGRRTLVQADSVRSLLA